MITPKIQALFDFIDFLHSNTENFSSHNDLIESIKQLIQKRNNLRPKESFEQRIEYDKTQEPLELGMQFISSTILAPIEQKFTELKIGDWNTSASLFNWNMQEIEKFHKTARLEDLLVIQESAKKYIDFRTTAKIEFCRITLFWELDEIMKTLFSYFPATCIEKYSKFEIDTFVLSAPQATNHTKIDTTLSPVPKEEGKPKATPKLIITKLDILDLLFSDLKVFFPNREDDFYQVLKGKVLKERLHFPHNQNKFVEVFKRLKYNNYLVNTPKEINNWLCANFTFWYKRGKKEEVRRFNASTVNDILTKERMEPKKAERICVGDWLPYKSRGKRKSEAE